MQQKWRVSKAEQGLNLLRFIKNQVPYSLRELRFFIEHHHCLVNGMIETFCSYKVQPNDHILLIPIPPAHPVLPLYEDDFFVAYNKPRYCESPVFASSHDLHLVHRLDFETTGLMLLAKAEAYTSPLQHLFRTKTIKKTYYACVHGTPHKTHFSLTTHTTKKQFAVNQSLWEAEETGTTMISSFTLLTTHPSYSFLACSPITGKTHQLRYHLSYLKHPIINDFRYGSRAHHILIQDQIPLLLHSYQKEFIHPWTQQTMLLQAPFPSEFKSFLESKNLWTNQLT